MPRKLAVLFVHGVEVSDEKYARTAVDLLTGAFARRAGVSGDEALVVSSAHWVPVLQDREQQLGDRLAGNNVKWFFDWLDRTGSAVTTGSAGALVRLLMSGLVRVLPGAGDFHWPTLRWLAVQYIGDAIAYQPHNKQIYGDVHAELARSLRELAEKAGPDAPLCVIAHSLGSVVVSNYFYDVQAPSLYPTAPELPTRVRAVMGSTPLERGETLAFLYTLGSPLALYMLGLTVDEMDRPVVVPHPKIKVSMRGHGGWTNFYSADDVIAAPLARLSAAYAGAVRDERVRVGPFPFGLTPLAHPWYWNDRRVMGRIAHALADARV